MATYVDLTWQRNISVTEKLPAREATQDLAAVSRTDPALNDRFLYGRSCKEFTGDQNTLPSPEDVFEALLCVPGGGLKVVPL